MMHAVAFCGSNFVPLFKPTILSNYLFTLKLIMSNVMHAMHVILEENKFNDTLENFESLSVLIFTGIELVWGYVPDLCLKVLVREECFHYC